MITHKYKHVLFDLDGTIYNTEFAYTSALYDVVKSEQPDTDETFDSLTRFMGSSAEETRKSLGINVEDSQRLSDLWFDRLKNYASSITPFDGVMSVIKYLKENGIKLGIITSRERSFENKLGEIASPLPSELKPYFTYSISASEVEKPKPASDSLLRYMEITGAQRDEILFIGDTLSDVQCAAGCGVDFGLAHWGSRIQNSIRCAHHFLNPWDIIGAVFEHNEMNYQWYKWAKEIQSIGQIGLTYTKNIFDIERFERLRDISCEILSTMTDEPFKKVRDAICMDTGYTTPKLETRAAVFNTKGEILLVKEAIGGKWSLPGGWCDENANLYSNAVKEVREEAGMIVNPHKLIGMLDKDKWNKTGQPYHIIGAFVLCFEGEGEFTPNSETLERRFFKEDEIPEENLRVSTTSMAQIKMCFDAYKTSNWEPVID